MALAAAHGVALIGGNITRSPGPLIVDVTAVGTVRPAAGADAAPAPGPATRSG